MKVEIKSFYISRHTRQRVGGLKSRNADKIGTGVGPHA
uniref:Uncharacterized protein n=2 Tax=unclassified Caudoviricetes TaxID=2788787 RepID=A0A8S5QKR1_9CAUD|nr:MAG TPA: hypothetical protein [Siphoviridae sp. ctVii20]DAE19385.1 MAG TPA: hypothetical protein [Siphoviridae sp. ctezl47]